MWPGLLMDYDLYERHAVVGRLLGERLDGAEVGSRILDVGGHAGLLDRFLRSRVVSVNPDGAGDLVAAGGELPFADRSFDAVVTIDTLEHVPRSGRLDLLRECVRVSRRFVLAAAPFGSEGHSACEARLSDLHRSVLGQEHTYLAEHVRYGLPDLAELGEWVGRLSASGVEYFFAGDYSWQARQFERAIRAQHRPAWIRRPVQLYNRVVSMALFRPIRLLERPAADTNRFYLLLDREGAAAAG